MEIIFWLLVVWGIIWIISNSGCEHDWYFDEPNNSGTTHYYICSNCGAAGTSHSIQVGKMGMTEIEAMNGGKKCSKCP